MKSKHGKLSIFLSLVLRHKPDAIKMELDDYGYLPVDKMIVRIQETGRHIDRQILDEIVSSDEKGRYSYNGDKSKIRANQGHSIEVDVGLKRSNPPKILYHGTSVENAESIKREGIKKQSRLYVHLTEDYEIAKKTGSRKGTSKVLKIDSQLMSKNGYEFLLSENGVWLTNNVPPKYLKE